MVRKESIKLPVSGEHVEISAPIVRVMRQAEQKYKTDGEKAIYIAASCCNLKEEEIENLDMLDYTAIQKSIEHFLEAAQ